MLNLFLKKSWKVCLEEKKYFEDVSVIKKLIPNVALKFTSLSLSELNCQI